VKLIISLRRGLVVNIVIIIALLIGGCASGSPSSATTSTSELGPNSRPVIDTIIPEWKAIERGKSSKIRCYASDPDGDNLNYTWESNRGSISGSGPVVTLATPNSYVDIIITVGVSDGRGGYASQQITVPVVCCSFAEKNPEWSE
jgi:hypothetical protein